MAPPSSPANAVEDVILLSVDGCEFRLKLAILAAASPIFADMSTLPPTSTSGGEDTRDGCPIISVQETSETITLLLDIIHPLRFLESAPSLDVACDLLRAADKYEMAKIAPTLGTLLINALPFDDEVKTVRLFTIAVKYNMNCLMQSTAAALLGIPPIHQLTTITSELDGIPATAYHKLLQYREHCISVVFPRRPTYDRMWIASWWVGLRSEWPQGKDNEPTWWTCPKCTKYAIGDPGLYFLKKVATWFTDHVERIKDAFSREVTVQSLLSPDLLDATIRSLPPPEPGPNTCECRQKAPAELVRLASLLAQKFQAGLPTITYSPTSG